MNRHELATIIRDFFLKNRDADHIEAKVEKDSYTVRVRFWKDDSTYLGEVLRILACLALVITAGCGGEYSVEIPPQEEASCLFHCHAAGDGGVGEGAVDAAPPDGGEGGVPVPDGSAHLDSGNDTSTDSSDAGYCPGTYHCGDTGTLVTMPDLVCVIQLPTTVYGAIQTPPECSYQESCGMYHCGCIEAHWNGGMGCGFVSCDETMGFPIVKCM